mmetsp:Transcript_120432/g.341222  ORF Transcript_120432/g.341222 Transcript_120432/m.341222 type:complete len:257 (+) Transcript_120432:299-1069(+)
MVPQVGVAPRRPADRPQPAAVAAEPPVDVVLRLELVGRARGVLPRVLDALFGEVCCATVVLLREFGLDHRLERRALLWGLAVQGAGDEAVGVLLEAARGDAVGAHDAAAGQAARLVRELLARHALELLQETVVALLVRRVRELGHRQAELFLHVCLVLLLPATHGVLELGHQVVVQGQAHIREEHDRLLRHLALRQTCCVHEHFKHRCIAVGDAFQCHHRQVQRLPSRCAPELLGNSLCLLRHRRLAARAQAPGRG